VKPLPKGHQSCLSPAFRYTPAASTNLARTFARIRRALKETEARDEAIAEEQQRVVAEMPQRKR